MCELICPEKHLRCLRYEKSESPTIELKSYFKPTRLERSLLWGEIIIVKAGGMIISYDHFLNFPIKEGQIILLPPGTKIKAQTEESTELMIFRIRDIVHLCESTSLEQLHAESDTELEGDQPYTLDVNKPVDMFIEPLSYYWGKGLRCTVFLNQKIQELMLLLYAFYPKEELLSFFSPLFNNTSDFTNFVLQNYRNVKTVKEFADLYSCSISSFDKKFRKAFKKAPYQWMQERKRSLIYNELHTTTKKMKQIAEEQGFTSLSQFVDYCRKHFGHSPGKLRKMASPEIEASLLSYGGKS